MKTRWILASALLVLPLAALPAGVSDTVHNLSVSGPGQIKATSETQVCVFCHTPHDANPAGPLWNHQLSSGVSYLKYTSSTMVAYSSQADAPDPNGASKLCLSCHDGVTAFNSLNQTPMIDSDNNISASSYTFASGGAAVVTMQDASPSNTKGTANLTTDLTNDHPISFTYDTALATLKGATLRDPAAASSSDGNGTGNLVIYRAGGTTGSIATQMLFVNPGANKTNQLECASCHEPHMQGDLASAASNYPFLIKSNQNSNLCLTCHNK